jgi:hypothetical protein
MIPYTRYPHPTLEEMDHSWMVVSRRNSLETTEPRRRPDSPQRGLSATGPVNPLQRSQTERSSAVAVAGDAHAGQGRKGRGHGLG